MLKGGVIMDVTNAEQAKIAEDAGAVAVMALERVPSDIRRDGGVARMSPVKKIREIQAAVSIPVMAKCRIGHFVEAQILEALGVDYIDESEVLTPADEHFHVDKFAFKVPFVCGCRDLGEADLCRSFTDFLSQHLRKTELLPHEADVMRAVILDSIAKGDALLLVDGLDEITNPQVRIMFCQELERTATRYPEAHIVATSRIVGYRDMPYRMGTGFEHGVIAEITREDKDLFARRWVDVTEQHQQPAEKEKRAQELLEALHSSDRIERLTGNPMLLTTLALVKRKVGKLPNRRTKLYAEAVSVLLNWNPRHYQTIEEDEAIPQLEYLAYEMCRQGVQHMTEDDVLDMLYNLNLAPNRPLPCER